jgi:hypothetical protein
MSNEITQTVKLTVVRVPGGGNTKDGRYFYSFDPANLMTEVPGQLMYRLSEDTSEGLRIRTVVSSASEGQLSKPVIGKDGLVAILQNFVLKEELINVAVLVTDEQDPGSFIICDPQVLNIPD